MFATLKFTRDGGVRHVKKKQLSGWLPGGSISQIQFVEMRQIGILIDG
ncbi:MAG: hypothetical protein KDB01_26720 [Planctomycetaceae bacterium]|nr:hypothetical protein [Planctomycetaceae bacterium]